MMDEEMYFCIRYRGWDTFTKWKIIVLYEIRVFSSEPRRMTATSANEVICLKRNAYTDLYTSIAIYQMSSVWQWSRRGKLRKR